MGGEVRYPKLFSEEFVQFWGGVNAVRHVHVKHEDAIKLTLCDFAEDKQMRPDAHKARTVWGAGITYSHNFFNSYCSFFGMQEVMSLKDIK